MSQPTFTVTLRTTHPNWQEWFLEVHDVKQSWSMLQLRQKLQRFPFALNLRTVSYFGSHALRDSSDGRLMCFRMGDDDPVLPELVMVNFDPDQEPVLKQKLDREARIEQQEIEDREREAELLRQAAERRARTKPPDWRGLQLTEEDLDPANWLPLPESRSASRVDHEVKEVQHWNALEIMCEGLTIQHNSQPPHDRQALSWGRTLAFSQVKLGQQGVPFRHGTERNPFLVWVLGATTQSELHLARRGFFRDANWLEREQTEVVLFGHDLPELRFQGEGAPMQNETWRPPCSRVMSGGVKKEDVVSWIVELPDGSGLPVWEQPGVGRIRQVGALFHGQVVCGRRDSAGWVKLDAASAVLSSFLWELDVTAYVRVFSNKGRRQLKRHYERTPPVGSRQVPTLEVWSAPYEGLRYATVGCQPDLVVVFMPTREPERQVPNWVLEIVSKTPSMVTLRSEPSEASMRALRRLKPGKILMGPCRSGFSTAPMDTTTKFDDNGWMMAVQGQGALATLLQLDLRPQRPQAVNAVPAVFWGIVDLKYDPSLPVFERVKMLETGDGRTSKFSGDGAFIPEVVTRRYDVDTKSIDLQRHHFLSGDKRLTHDIMELSGYQHLLPRQALFNRVYHDGLEQEIKKALELGDDDYAVLKLCNRSRAAGVVVTPAKELDIVLQDLLQPPEHLERWLERGAQRMRDGAVCDLGISSNFDEHQRHWWANEHPAFIVERWCQSMSTFKEGLPFDGTMRVAFALRKRANVVQSQPQGMAKPSTATLNPEDLQIDWLGGYWKLPKACVYGDNLRERTISAARVSGTAPVSDGHLAEVYAALGNSIQHLFGGAQPTPHTLQQQYELKHPAVAAYLTARLGSTNSSISEAHSSLTEHLKGLQPMTMRQTVSSYTHRCLGAVEAKRSDVSFAGRWNYAKDHLKRSLELQPSNATTLFLMGMAALDQSHTQEARDLLNKSLLLDCDFRACYINLGVVYLRLGMCQEAIDISEAGLARFPDTPQANYHIGVAYCQLAMRLDTTDAEGNDLSKDSPEYQALRQTAHENLVHSRSSPEAGRRVPQSGKLKMHPWQTIDDNMVKAMARKQKPEELLQLPLGIGWRLYAWRF